MQMKQKILTIIGPTNIMKISLRINNPLNLPLVRETFGIISPTFEKGDLGGC